MSLALIQNASPETAVVLGSGLGSVVDGFGVEAEVSFASAASRAKRCSLLKVADICMKA
jgi:hypothetical protein